MHQHANSVAHMHVSSVEGEFWTRHKTRSQYGGCHGFNPYARPRAHPYNGSMQPQVQQHHDKGQGKGETV